MDIENNYEQELVFQIEPKNKEDKQTHKQKKNYWKNFGELLLIMKIL